MTEEETKFPPVENILGPQLASDDTFKRGGISDARRLSRINEAEVLALSYLNQIPDNEGGEYVRDFIQDFLNLKMSLDGWRARQIIDVVRGSKGMGAASLRTKPGWWARNIYERDWEKKAELEGQTVIE